MALHVRGAPAIVAVLYLIVYLPHSSNMLPSGVMEFLRLVSGTLLGGFFMWWMLRSLRDACDSSARAAELTGTLREHERARRALEGELAAERRRSQRLKDAAIAARAAAPDGDGPREDDAPVVISSPTQAICLRPSEVLFAESLNRQRVIHLTSGEALQVNTTLAQIAGQLPEGRFAYCHRSVVVNLAYVERVEGTEAVLSGDVRVPVGRRRVTEFGQLVERYRTGRASPSPSSAMRSA